MTSEPEHADVGSNASAAMPDELSPRHIVRRLVELAVLAAVVAVAISALPGLGTLRHRFVEADAAFVVLAGVLKLASCLSNILAFRDVFCPSLGWGFSYRLGMAEQATNVLLPTGGAGGAGPGRGGGRGGGGGGGNIPRRPGAVV